MAVESHRLATIVAETLSDPSVSLQVKVECNMSNLRAQAQDLWKRAHGISFNLLSNPSFLVKRRLPNSLGALWPQKRRLGGLLMPQNGRCPVNNAPSRCHEVKCAGGHSEA